MDTTKKISVFGRLETPFITKIDEMSFVQVQDGMMYDEKLKKYVPKMVVMVNDAQIHACVDPSQPFAIGDVFGYIKGNFEVTEIEEVRAAKGDYSFL